jgi:uncharacterized surface protein with fasciclin (FAS1) repeats
MKYILSFLVLVLLTACFEDNSEERFSTFEEATLAQYLASSPDFSEFYRAVCIAGLEDLLGAYGEYTCFAPTNAAMNEFYSKSGKSLETMTREEIAELACNHVLTAKISSTDFPDGVIPYTNLNLRYIYISTEPAADALNIFVNENSKIIQVDQKVHNGVIHTIDATLSFSKAQLPELISSDSRFSLFSEALFSTGLADSMRKMQEYDYVPGKVKTMLNNEWEFWDTPPTFRYGYTALIESDETLSKYSIGSIDDLKSFAADVYDRMYPEDKEVSDITNRRNSLNRFVAYHLLDGEYAENDFLPPIPLSFYTKGAIVPSYLQPICPNTLIEVRDGNLFNQRRNGDAIHIISPNHAAENGVYHEIDRILLFDETVINDVLNKRIRIDAVDIFPELASNKIRNAHNPTLYYTLPRNYVKNVSYTELTELQYRFCAACINFRGDELMLGGHYDFTMTLPPIPAGTYEIRMGYAATSLRGVAQLYFDGIPVGIPLDMRIGADDPKIGWIADSETEDNGVENDKMMHNRGYLKAPDVALCQNWTAIQRNVSANLRLVLAVRTFEKMQPHTLRVKSVMDRTNLEFQVDYFEFVPTSMLLAEGRD